MSTRHSRPNGPARIYRFLLLLYPPGFRLRFGAEMLQVFQDCYPAEARGVRLEKRLAFWYATFVDLLRSLPEEWRQVLIRPRKFELPLRQWADSMVIPFTVLGYLMVEGNLGAALVRTPPVLPWAHACTDGWAIACMVSMGMAIAFTLAFLGMLSALITARNSRAEIWSLNLHSPGNSN